MYRVTDIKKFNNTILPCTNLNDRLHAIIYIDHDL